MRLSIDPIGPGDGRSIRVMKRVGMWTACVVFFVSFIPATVMRGVCLGLRVAWTCVD